MQEVAPWKYVVKFCEKFGNSLFQGTLKCNLLLEVFTMLENANPNIYAITKILSVQILLSVLGNK